ncbi:MAG: hypothetical protein ACLQU2_20000 [Candidatus Binataceae bacterium]
MARNVVAKREEHPPRIVNIPYTLTIDTDGLFGMFQCQRTGVGHAFCVHESRISDSMLEENFQC